MADMQTFIHERLLPDSSGIGRVNMDDGATFLARFVNGAMDTFVSSLYATARCNHQRVKIYGDQRALVYLWENTDHRQAAVPRDVDAHSPTF